MEAHPTNKWGGLDTRKLLLYHWPLFMVEPIAYIHIDTMDYFEGDIVIGVYIRDFVCRSSTDELQNRVKYTYSNL